MNAKSYYYEIRFRPWELRFNPIDQPAVSRELPTFALSCSSLCCFVSHNFLNTHRDFKHTHLVFPRGTNIGIPLSVHRHTTPTRRSRSLVQPTPSGASSVGQRSSLQCICPNPSRVHCWVQNQGPRLLVPIRSTNCVAQPPRFLSDPVCNCEIHKYATNLPICIWTTFS